MDTAAWLTLLAIVVGPIAAVAITLVIEGRRRARETQIQVLRMLISTRHLPSDPAYSTAINLVPVEFQGNSKVMAAWNSYIEAVRYTPAEQDRETHQGVQVARQTTLIFRIMQALGFQLSESDIQISAYASSGQIWRDHLYLDYLRATREIAEALKRQTQLLEANIPEPSADSAAEPTP